MIVHPAYPCPCGASTKAVSFQIDLAPTLLALTGKPADAVARVGAGLKGRDLSKVLSAPEHASTTAVRPAALFNYNMFTYLDAKWLGAMVRIRASKGSTMKMAKLVTLQPNWRNRGAMRSIFDGRYRFSRYFSPIEFNRPTTYEDLVAKNDLEIYDLQEDPQETRQSGTGRQRQSRSHDGSK
jgi:arylsulfatase A-like enzyme